MAHELLYSSSFTCEWTYDVFLSFRGEDTRTNFTSNLYHSLHQRGIVTFMDDVGLQRGEEITPALLEASQQSRIAIVVFSKNYASSTFCLDELVHILEHVKGAGRLVWPVFYGVDPSQVRHQSGSYGTALAKHEERFQANKELVRKWRKALSEAGNISGWHFQHRSQSEYKFISGIIEEVSKKINRIPLHVANYPVGLESSVHEVITLLELGSDEGVHMVGIHGIGGIGKTTIARAVYNLIGDQFEGLCFLADTREKAINRQGLVQLQETLLSEVVAENDIKLGDVNRGIPILKRRLGQKKVLLIIDDVDNLQQLRATAGRDYWFGFGSRIIVTTRNKHLLTSHGIVKLFEVKELNASQSLELFSWNAFKNNKIDPSYVGISNRIVLYASGLPLALEVIGSNLFGKGLEKWKSLLEKYERIPNKEVHEILKVSYDNLEEDEKEIFLDIACFFNKFEVRYVKEILYVRGFHAEIGIQVLMDKSLIRIDGSNCVIIHDLIRDMGREIVRQESTFEPGKRSRLWFDEDIVHVLEDNTGTDKIEVIMLNLYEDKVQWSGEAFRKMENLRILIIGNAHFSRGPTYLPNGLRLLDWSGYTSLSLPSDFNPKKLVILSLPESCLKIFEPLKMFQSLCFLDFEGCKFLTQISDLSGVPNLGALCLDNCKNLIKVHHSVGFLVKLRLLSAQGCSQLEMLASCIRLTSLETLDLRGCSSLKFFPDVLGTMENIRDVYLDETAIQELPFSIGNLIGLERLYLRHCARLIQLPSNIMILPKLEVILAYGSRGFKLFRGYEIQEKMCSEMSIAAFLLCCRPKGSYVEVFYYLNVHGIITNPNNYIQVIGFWNPYVHFDPCLSPSMSGSKETPVSFWFRDKFPKTAVSLSVEPGRDIENSILDIKLSILVNGAEQLICFCNYIFPTENKITIWCGLQGKHERVIAAREWNQVEVSWDLKYHRPYYPHRLISEHNVIPTETMEWTTIYVCEEENAKENIRFTNPNISVSQAPMINSDNRRRRYEGYIEVLGTHYAILLGEPEPEDYEVSGCVCVTDDSETDDSHTDTKDVDSENNDTYMDTKDNYNSDGKDE